MSTALTTFLYVEYFIICYFNKTTEEYTLWNHQKTCVNKAHDIDKVRDGGR